MLASVSERLRFACLDEVPGGVCVLSEHFTVVFWNRQLEAWTRLPREEMLGTDLRSRFPRLGEGELAGRLEASLAGATQELEGGFGLVRGSTPEGVPRRLRTCAAPLPALDVCRYALLLVEDVTALETRLGARVADLERELARERGRSAQLKAQLEKRSAALAQHHSRELEDACDALEEALQRIGSSVAEAQREERAFERAAEARPLELRVVSLDAIAPAERQVLAQEEGGTGGCVVQGSSQP